MKLKTATVGKDSTVQDNGMNEIYQSQKTQQALLRRDGPLAFTRITNYVKCRDFLVDSFTYAKAKQDFGIYGFKFPGSKMSPPLDETLIVMHFHDDKSRECFLKNIDLIIRPVEKKNKYTPTELLAVEGSKDVVAVGDKAWLQNCLSMSFYSLLLRVCCYDFDASKDWITEFGKKSWSDSKYIASIPRVTLDKVLDDLSTIETKNFCGFDPKKVEVHTIHHNSGFVSVFGWHSEISPETVKTNQHWQEMKKRGLATKVA